MLRRQHITELWGVFSDAAAESIDWVLPVDTLAVDVRLDTILDRIMDIMCDLDTDITHMADETVYTTQSRS